MFFFLNILFYHLFWYKIKTKFQRILLISSLFLVRLLNVKKTLSGDPENIVNYNNAQLRNNHDKM